ncbi:Protein of unknown function [Escherichia coli D6-117.29]|nr:Protein of unknown function [Escherichia coli D6-117.29]
MVINEDVDKKE